MYLTSAELSAAASYAVRVLTWWHECGQRYVIQYQTLTEWAHSLLNGRPMDKVLANQSGVWVKPNPVGHKD